MEIWVGKTNWSLLLLWDEEEEMKHCVLLESGKELIREHYKVMCIFFLIHLTEKPSLKKVTSILEGLETEMAWRVTCSHINDLAPLASCHLHFITDSGGLDVCSASFTRGRPSAKGFTASLLSTQQHTAFQNNSLRSFLFKGNFLECLLTWRFSFWIGLPN